MSVPEGDIRNGISFIKRAETVIAAVITAAIFWVGNSVSDMRIQITGMERDLQHIKSVQTTEVEDLRNEINSLRYNMSTIWPRLRNTQADVQIMWRELDRLTKGQLGKPQTGTFIDPGEKANAASR